MGEIEKRKGPALDRVVGGAGGAAISVLAALLIGPEAAAVLGNASGPLVEETSYALRAVIQRRARKIEQAGEAACRKGQCTFEEIVEKALGDDRKIELITRVLQAAAVAEEERKVRALGRALARGVLTSEDALVDAELRITSALASLEPVDIRALALMAGEKREWIKRPLDDQKDNEWAGVLIEADSGLAPVVDSIIARLSTYGLIGDESEGGFRLGGSSWRITHFGRTCLESLMEQDGHEYS
ncbi:hypothetical protein AB0L13_45300 [Saccharopolyspora shandongensis]|uniref:hypothetical protein n=1 Tax=Saccharopolyspora shandongensis TaxID=418495 RepID=UPI003417FD91